MYYYIYREREFSLGTHVRILLLHGGHAGVQQSTVVNWEKHFCRRYGAAHKATCQTFAYIEDAIICVINMQDLMVSCLRGHKHVHRVTEEYRRTCAPSENYYIYKERKEEE